MSVGYPGSAASYSTPRLRPPSAGTAESLVLVALILQVIGGVLVFIGIAALLGVSYVHPFAHAWAVAIVAATVGALVVVFLYFAYTLSYQRIQRDDYFGAQAPTLIIGILSIFLGLVPGILYLVGYVKLGDAIRESQAPPPGYGPAYGMPFSAAYPTAQIACKGCGRVYPVGQFPFCPNCGQKMGP